MGNFITQTATSTAKATLLLCCVLAFTSCRKADNTVILSGTYTGKYLYANSGVVYNQGQQGATITFTGSNYSASYYTTNPAANSITLTNTGKYTLRSDSVTFNSDAIVPGILQTAQVFLNGSYEYHFEGDSLIITKNYAPYSYNQYRLKKN